MSNRPRQHWQDDTNEYTFNQYAFYLVVLGLLIVALGVTYYIWIQQPPRAVTYLVAITSKPGGDLPVIPFQNEDSASFKKTFAAKEFETPSYSRFAFDDKESFRRDVIENLKLNWRADDQIVTIVIWMSAVGSVQNDLPVIRLSNRQETLALDDLIRPLSELDVENVVLLLDCGHEFVDPTAYQSSSRADSDFNPFSTAVQKWVAANETGNVHVIINGDAGEKPLYSITRRRSLFGYALESLLKLKSESGYPMNWNITEFHRQLDELCLQLGGDSAPHVNLLDKTIETVGKQKFFGLQAPDEPEEGDEESTKDPARVQFDPEYLNIARDLDRTWKEYSDTQKYLEKYNLPPSTLDSAKWHQLTMDAVDLTAIELQSGGPFTANCTGVQSKVVEFRNSQSKKAREISGKLNLLPDPDLEQPESTEITDKRQVADALFRVFETECRLPHYLALTDSLSWILPTSPYVDSLREHAIELSEMFGKIKNRVEEFAFLNLNSPLAEPSLDHFGEIQNACGKILDQEKILQNDLISIFRFVLPSEAGFQREMAVQAFLRLPFLDVIETPDAGKLSGDDSNSENPDPEFGRPALRQLLTTNPLNSRARIQRNLRQSASSGRIDLYRKFVKSTADEEKANPVSNRLLVFAYRFGDSRFPLESFAVRDRSPQPQVTTTRGDELQQEGIYVERKELGGTDLDLGLDVRNADVELQCQIINDDAARYFRFTDSTSREKTFPWTENPRLEAIQGAPENLPDNPNCRLKILIVDRNVTQNGKPKQYRVLDIPIRLPLKNSIAMFVDVAGKTFPFHRNIEGDSEFEIGDPIRPFANLDDACNFRLLNQWHNKRTGTVFLYACASQENEIAGQRTIAGRIDSLVAARTRAGLNSSLEPLQLVATGTIDLPAYGESAEPRDVQWQHPAGAADEPVKLSVNHGFLCVIKLDNEPDAWHYWIPIFPVEKPIVTVEPRVQSGDVFLKVIRDSAVSFPENEPLRIDWSFSGNRVDPDFKMLSPRPDADPEDEFETFKIAEGISSNDRNSYLYIDVQQWPRKYVFRFNGSTFTEATTKDAKIDVRLGTAENDQPQTSNVLTDLNPNQDSEKRIGTAASERTVTVNLSFNVPTGGSNFSFDSANDYIGLFDSGNDFKLFYPRQIDNVVELPAKSDRIYVNSRVSDYQLTFPDIKGDRFQITPTLHLSGQDPERLAAQGRSADQPSGVQILFDQDKPVIPEQGIRVLSPTPIYTGQSVRISVEASDEPGVGIDDQSGVKIFLSGAQGEKKESRWQREGNNIYKITAPEEPGKYFVGVQVTDRVGNEQKRFDNNDSFMVLKKPPPKPVTPPVEPAYELTLTVAGDFGAPITEPELEIEPKLDPPARSPDGKYVYVYKGLKKGTTYTIKGQAKLAGGDRAELKGTLSYTPKNRLKEEANLTLKR